jgi:hypothetical protein
LRGALRRSTHLPEDVSFSFQPPSLSVPTYSISGCYLVPHYFLQLLSSMQVDQVPSLCCLFCNVEAAIWNREIFTANKAHIRMRRTLTLLIDLTFSLEIPPVQQARTVIVASTSNCCIPGCLYLCYISRCSNIPPLSSSFSVFP